MQLLVPLHALFNSRNGFGGDTNGIALAVDAKAVCLETAGCYDLVLLGKGSSSLGV